MTFLKVVLSNGAIAIADSSEPVDHICGFDVYDWQVTYIGSDKVVRVIDRNGEGEGGINLRTLQLWGERQFAEDPHAHFLMEMAENFGGIPEFTTPWLESCFDLPHEEIE
jgi:hypothetical protein